MNRIRPILLSAAIFLLGSVIGKSQAIISQGENFPLNTNVTTAGGLTNQFSAFIVGEKPIALNNISFSAKKNGAGKVSVSVYKGTINGVNATLLNKLASASVNMSADEGDYKKFAAAFSNNLMLDAWGTYYIVLKNESPDGHPITVAMASNIGAVKANGVTALGGVFYQDVAVTGNAKGVIDPNAFIGVNLNGPANALPIVPPTFSLSKFSGSVQRGRALLQWKIDNAENMRNAVLEKSNDQNNFSSVSNPTSNSFVNVMDGLNGRTYYRLKMTDLSGKVSYSKLLTLEPRVFFSAKLIQSQLTKGQNVKVEVNASENMQSLIMVVDRFGTVVKKISQQISSGYSNVQFTTADMNPGNYFIKCSGGSNEFVSEMQMIVL